MSHLAEQDGHPNPSDLDVWEYPNCEARFGYPNHFVIRIFADGPPAAYIVCSKNTTVL